MSRPRRPQPDHPANRRSATADYQSLRRDCGSVPGRRTRHPEFPPDQCRPAGPSRRSQSRFRRGLLDFPTALNMAMMFSGVFIVFVNARYGPRRILLPAAAIFTIASALVPLAPAYWVMLTLLVITGIASGTFYSLTLTFVLTALPKRLIIFGIAAYAADIVFVSNFASAIEGWYVDHLSWQWIFWNASLFTPLMMLCVYFGIPRRPLPTGPRPNWRGFAYFSLGLSLLYAALDQGERLDW